MRPIDLHAHVTPECFRRAVADGGTFFGMDASYGELHNPKNTWTIAERLADMDALGVGMHAVSVTDCFYQYDQDVETTRAIARACNDELAEMARAYPDRFVGLGNIPMQDIGAAISEMERAMLELGLKGFMINDHVNGHNYDEPQFLPFWKAAEELGAVILFHQYGPTLVSARTEDYFLPNSIGNLVDRAVVFGTLVHGGVMDRFPGLKLVLAHGGGYTAFGAARMDKAWEAAAIDYMPKDARRNISRPPSTYLGAFSYDCCTQSEATLRFLIDQVGIDQVVFGTDYPAPMIIDDAVNWVNGLASLTAEEKEAILWRNPARLLGL
jgi:aminocarboxymuconate-semialdehyde decarboxylase